MILRKHLIFSGRVQGVGFRYQARHLAQSLGLTGWVKNLWDERVEMEVQGEEAQIYRLIEELSRGRFIYIERVESETIPVDYHESSFRVTGY
ncbi:MAG: acylphosphatase [Clostridium sp.]|nr:acylphosphatase [Clostridium sp.]MBQ4148143.1 acylphosphatase [Clostridium sp.]MBQ5421010.1 acylphosphatase [Clostridium sp.]HAE80793.1 acylphosphatase [Lachnoclostridium sp.]